METAAIQASLQFAGVGWRSPLSPLATLHFFQLCGLKHCSPLYFESMLNLSKTLEGLLTPLVIFLSTIFQLNSLNIKVIRVRVRVKGE